MVRGLGTDIVDITRIDAAIRRHGRGFANRILSSQEMDEFDGFSEKRKSEFLAGRFAAKEAIAKAIGCGLAKLHMRDVDIRIGKTGLSVSCGKFAEQLISKEDAIYVSISHTASVAYAVAIWESACQGCT
jgi:holo-[acyl-carrier protein] synthase